METDWIGAATGTKVAPEAERGFIDSLAESFTRGSKTALADVAVYYAMEHPEEDMVGVLTARKKLAAGIAADPIEGRYLTHLAYTSANTVGQMIEGVKRAGVGAIVGAAAGGVAGAVAGSVVPGVGTAAGFATGASAGAKLGGGSGEAIFAYHQMAGAIYADLVEQGIDPKTAEWAAKLGGVPAGVLSAGGLNVITAPGRRLLSGKVKALVEDNAKNAIVRGLAVYAKGLGANVGVAEGSEMLRIAAERGAKVYQDGGALVDKEFLHESAQSMWKTLTEGIEGSALLPIPGALIESYTAFQATRVNKEIAKTLIDHDGRVTLMPKDVSDPSSQLTLGLLHKLREVQDATEGDVKAAYIKHAERAQEKGVPADDFTTFEVKYRSKKVSREQETIRAEERRDIYGKGMEKVIAESNASDWLNDTSSYLKGKTFTKLGITPLDDIVPVETFYNLQEGIRTNTAVLKPFEQKNLGEAFKRIYFDGGNFTDYERKLAAKHWSPNVVSALEAIGQLGKEKKLKPVTDLNDFMREVASSMDLSRILRQEVLNIGSPKRFFKTAAVSAKLYTMSPEQAQSYHDTLVKSDHGQVASKYGVVIRNVGGGFETGSEFYPSTAARRIPGVKGSEQGFVEGGNYSRIERFGTIYDSVKGHASDTQLKDIAHIVNIMSGEGDATWLGKHAHMLNSVFFAPRFFTSRLQVLNELFNPLSGTSWMARKYLAWEATKFVGVNAGVLAGLAQVPGVHVEGDPRSTDFGKIEIGNTHVDFWGGYLPLFRTVYRLASGQRKTQGGQIVDADMKDTIARFLQSKLGPVPSGVLDFWRGETFYGNKRDIRSVDDITSAAYEKLTPFFIQDIVDAIQYQGFGSATYIAPLSFLGASTQTYPMTKGTQVALTRNSKSNEVFGKPWDNLGPEGQKYMRHLFPEIVEGERQAKFEKDNSHFMETIEKNALRSQKKMNSGMPKDVQQELTVAGLQLGGVNRRVGTDWYLNDARYKDYENSVLKDYQDVLTKLVRGPTWGRLNPTGKAEMFKRITEQIKDAERRRIIRESNRDDLIAINYNHPSGMQQ